MITTHPAYPELLKISKEQNKKIHIVLAETLENLRTEAAIASKKPLDDFSLTELTKDIHFYPDLHGESLKRARVPVRLVLTHLELELGNRSPLADPDMRGSIVGLALDSGLNDLAKKFNITLEVRAFIRQQGSSY